MIGIVLILAGASVAGLTGAVLDRSNPPAGSALACVVYSSTGLLLVTAGAITGVIP